MSVLFPSFYCKHTPCSCLLGHLHVHQLVLQGNCYCQRTEAIHVLGLWVRWLMFLFRCVAVLVMFLSAEANSPCLFRATPRNRILRYSVSRKMAGSFRIPMMDKKRFNCREHPVPSVYLPYVRLQCSRHITESITIREAYSLSPNPPQWREADI